MNLDAKRKRHLGQTAFRRQILSQYRFPRLNRSDTIPYKAVPVTTVFQDHSVWVVHHLRVLVRTTWPRSFDPMLLFARSCLLPSRVDQTRFVHAVGDLGYTVAAVGKLQVG